MGSISIKIQTDNAAFDDTPEIEVARILKRLANDIENNNDPEYLFDYNGNKVGTLTVFEDYEVDENATR